jgi:hypothetical protein
MSLANYLEDALVNHVCLGGGAYTRPSSLNVKLHTADPGETGASNAAATTLRKAITFGAASGGVATQVGTISWTSVANAETVSHFSIWDDISAGNCLGYGQLTASKSLQVGDNLDLTGLTFGLD